MIVIFTRIINRTAKQDSNGNSFYIPQRKTAVKDGGRH